ncbi:MAG: ATP-grasp domain-containing protein [Acidimicrobiales bacterium]
MPHPDRRVALVMPSATYRATDFAAAAAALDVELVVATEHRQAMSGSMGWRALVVDLCDTEGAARAIAGVARDHPLAAVVAVDDQGVEVAARAAELLGLRHSSPASVHLTRDKVAMRRCLGAAGVRQPAFRVSGPGRAAHRGTELGFPVVIKPMGMAGSRGVIRADDRGAAQAAEARIRAILDEEGRPGEEDLLVERFVPGAEVAVEAVMTGGRLRVLAVFDKPDPLDGPYFEETIYLTPPRLSAAQGNEIISVVAEAVAALGLSEGPVHAELRLAAEGPTVLEVAARTIGGLCGRALRFGAGISLEQVILSHALGLDPDDLAPPSRASGVMMIPIPAAGRLRSVEGLEAARRVGLVDGIEITVPVDTWLRPLPEGDRYLGFIFASGPSSGAVEAALRDAHRALSFQMEGSAPPGGHSGEGPPPRAIAVPPAPARTP